MKTSIAYLGKYTIAHGEITDPDHQGSLILSIKLYFPNSSQVNHNKPRPWDYSFNEWLKAKIGHTNVNKSVKNAVLNEWILDSFDVKSSSLGISNDPYSRGLEEYNRRLITRFYSWQIRFEEEERWESGLNKTYYDPPQVSVETVEVKRYSFENGKSFIYVTKMLDDDLPLGQANGSRFKGMIRKGMDTTGSVQRET
ncbi:hypothetical protein Tco_0860188 [Tanacetum coccineum]|uniref:Uncharacterized protein n=1 Tax=Tanacetum coccineum TaxID=301880 RepID=A0ABQ5BE63_9ASTR